MIILLHTSKTMRVAANAGTALYTPLLSNKVHELASYMRTLEVKQIATIMRVSAKLADEVADKYLSWTDDSNGSSAAIDSFIGDIYSGLQAGSLSETDRLYAHGHLYILSGLYGILRPLDAVMSYRLEMGYKLPDGPYANLYSFWGNDIAKVLPAEGLIINLAAVEYSRLVTPFVDEARVITPRFLTVSEKTNEPVFVVVHAKIARGAFARWMIVNKIESVELLRDFKEIGYRYDRSLSTPNEPVFVCREFGGKGLSIRLEGEANLS